jgi:hypothetical protein
MCALTPTRVVCSHCRGRLRFQRHWRPMLAVLLVPCAVLGTTSGALWATGHLSMTYILVAGLVLSLAASVIYSLFLINEDSLAPN